MGQTKTKYLFVNQHCKGHEIGGIKYDQIHHYLINGF